MRALLILALALAACAPRAAPVLHSATSSAPRPANFADSDAQDFGRVSPADHPVHGIDLSKFQTAVDWPTARANGVNFAFIKATEGGDAADPLFRAHWQGAAAAGVPRGAYHFFYHCRPAIEQARWFIAHVPREAGALPPVLDMEWTPTSPTCRTRHSADHIRSEAHIFLNALAAHYGQRPILYTAIDFFEDNQLWRLQGTEFWLRSVAAHPHDLYGGQAWSFWQYSSTGRIDGIKGNVDLNTFAGSHAAWANWLSARSQ